MYSIVSRGLVGISLLALLSSCNAGNPGAALGLGQQAAAPAAATAAPVAGAVVQGTCPQISLREGTASYRTYAGRAQEAENVVYQASLVDTTRACVRNETNLGITAMVKGRVTSGPQGKAGTISMPIRVTVVDGDTTLYSELTRMDVTISDPAQPTQFVFTKDNIAVPATLSSFTRVFIGFDEGPAKRN